MAKPNYQFKKRQKELAKKEKKELKRQRKIVKKTVESEIQQDQIQKTMESPETT